MPYQQFRVNPKIPADNASIKIQGPQGAAYLQNSQ